MAIIIEFNEEVVDIGPNDIWDNGVQMPVIGYGALIANNYKINELQILNVVKTENPRKYRLSTTTQTERMYEVFVQNVADHASNSIDTANNSATFSGIAQPGSGRFLPIRAYTLPGNKVRIEFTENLDFETALVVGNYSIMGLDVLDVEKIDESSIELTTSKQVKTLYGITMTDIKSAGG